MTPLLPAFPSIRNEIAGLPVADLAQQFGTPTFVYDASKIIERLDDLRAFDVIRYAQKACSNLAIVDLVRQNGAFVDAVSAGEIHRALAAGYSPSGASDEPPPIVYTADLFDHDALDLVVERNIHVNCGSPDMIAQYGQRVADKAITLRINPGFGHGHSRKTNTGGPLSKHGIWHEQIPDCLAEAARHRLRVTGLHVHIGSGTDLDHLSQICVALERAAFPTADSLDSISVGGGLPIPYQSGDAYVDLDAYFRCCDQTRKRLEQEFGRPICLEIEPGRYISAESGYLIAEIRAVKKQGPNTFYLIDAGFHNLARPILYGAYHPISVVPIHGNPERPLQEVIVGGPLCESGDVFTQEDGGFVVSRSLPVATVGDLLLIECAGAYGFTMSSNYNSRPFAAEVLILDNSPHCIRRRQTFDELYAAESMLDRPNEHDQGAPLG